MSYILGARGFSCAVSGFAIGSAEDEAPDRRTREKTSGAQGICPTVRHKSLGGSNFFDFSSNPQK